MKLTTEQIASIAKGVVRVYEENDKVYLCRFTKEQEELYKVRSTDFYRKSFATSGVTLEFVTDSRTLALEVSIGFGSSRFYFEHSIFVNGKKYANLGCKGSEGGVFGGKWRLPEGDKTVKIYFPWSVSSKITELSLDDGASLTPVKSTKKMIMFGDSITHGYDASAPELSYASRLADALGAEAVNKGIGAEVFYPDMAAAKDPICPDYITVAYGTNDWSKKSQDFYANCKEFYENLSRNYPQAKIFAITPIWRKSYGEANTLGTLDDIEAYIKEVAASLPNVTAISGIDLVPHDPKYFSPDVLHPNDRGFKHYANNLFEKIKNYID
jgi:lysophospholipase L1-like esterase